MEPLAGRVDLEMRRILILGGAGFIGANLVERILEKEEMDETEGRDEDERDPYWPATGRRVSSGHCRVPLSLENTLD